VNSGCWGKTTIREKEYQNRNPKSLGFYVDDHTSQLKSRRKRGSPHQKEWGQRKNKTKKVPGGILDRGMFLGKQKTKKNGLQSETRMNLVGL